MQNKITVKALLKMWGLKKEFINRIIDLGEGNINTNFDKDDNNKEESND